ncbi:MAG: hypothetical protein HC799_16205 [Limnothrix sp. RL_2_0]|nr:hypothetical protein [Limnothrix sp. RL_2_0]
MAIARWIFALISVFLIAVFVESARKGSVAVGHPIFILICFLLYGGLGFGINYIFKPVIVKIGGCPNRFFWQCIWQGVFQCMAMFFGLVLSVLFFAGLFLQQLPSLFQTYGNEPPSEANFIWIPWLMVTLGIYLLEAWTKIPPAQQNKRRAALPRPTRSSDEVGNFKNEVDDLLGKIKRNQKP